MSIATGLLAWKTWSMARETKGVAQATFKVAEATLTEAKAVERQSEQMERQLAISVNALSSSIQPWLVWEASFDVPVNFRSGIFSRGPGQMVVPSPGLEVSERDDSVVGWFRVRNVGAGLAILNMSESRIYRRNGGVAYDDVHLTIISPVLPPGKTADVEFTIPVSKAPDGKKMTILQLAGNSIGDELFAIEIAYSDSLGGAQTSARFLAHRNEAKDQAWSIDEVEYRLASGEVVKAGRYG
jgi:hypothetical protein